jgi:Methylase involved in ubiquinone/menaquinone biosynthesis
MSSLLTPARRRGYEILDDPDIDDALRARSLADVARSNMMFGGWRAVRAELAAVLVNRERRSVTLLDVGTGIGDIPSLAIESWRARGLKITTFGVDLSACLLRQARDGGVIPICAMRSRSRSLEERRHRDLLANAPSLRVARRDSRAARARSRRTRAGDRERHSPQLARRGRDPGSPHFLGAFTP